MQRVEEAQPPEGEGQGLEGVREVEMEQAQA
jgi:hypothetical protein